MVAAKYASLIVILGLYLGTIAYGVANPDVSDAYRAHYIERTGMAWTHRDGETYVWGQNINPGRQGNTTFPVGWSVPDEEAGRRATATRSIVRFIPQDRTYAGPVCVMLRGVIDPPQSGAKTVSVVVHLNDVPIGALHGSGSDGDFFVRYQGRVAAGEAVSVRFESSRVSEGLAAGETPPLQAGLSLRALIVENLACRG